MNATRTDLLATDMFNRGRDGFDAGVKEISSKQFAFLLSIARKDDQRQMVEGRRRAYWIVCGTLADEDGPFGTFVAKSGCYGSIIVAGLYDEATARMRQRALAVGLPTDADADDVVMAEMEQAADRAQSRRESVA